LGSWVVPTFHLLGVGWYFATCIILDVFIGHWVDGRTGLEPIFTLVGIFLGLAIAFVGGIRLLQPLLNSPDSEPTEKR